MQNLRCGFDGRQCREIRYFEIYRNSLAGCSIISRANKSAKQERDDFSSNGHRALSFCLSMIFSEKPVPTLR